MSAYGRVRLRRGDRVMILPGARNSMGERPWLEGREGVVVSGPDGDGDWLVSAPPLPEIPVYVQAEYLLVLEPVTVTAPLPDDELLAQYSAYLTRQFRQMRQPLLCEADGCGEPISSGERYYYHSRLMARVHVSCYHRRTVKGEDISQHAITLREAP